MKKRYVLTCHLEFFDETEEGALNQLEERLGEQLAPSGDFCEWEIEQDIYWKETVVKVNHA